MNDAAAPRGGSFPYKRLLPVAVLVLGLVAFFVLDLDRYLSFETLRQNRAALLNWVDTYGIVAALIYMLIYAVAIAFFPAGRRRADHHRRLSVRVALGHVLRRHRRHCWCHGAVYNRQDVVWRRPCGPRPGRRCKRCSRAFRKAP